MDNENENATGEGGKSRSNGGDKLKLSGKSTATEAQIAKLKELLRWRPHHTHELRRVGISHPAGRVQDLLKRGFEVESSRIVTVDGDGYQHFGVALYSLVSEPSGGAHG